jgi:hypothetical protein
MSTWNLIEQQQKALCDKLTIDWVPVDLGSLIAFNDSLLSPTNPINGLRHPGHGNMVGWYLWSGGEIPQHDAEFFKPLHVEHLLEARPIVLKYLGLPPGWWFQIDDDGYEDLWYDKSLLEI